MKKDQADQFEQELIQPARTGPPHVGLAVMQGRSTSTYDPSRLMTGERVEYAAWLEVELSDARTKSSLM